MVKRYNIECNAVGEAWLEPEPDGKVVLFDDYVALEGQLNLMSKSREAWKENATALEKERDALQAECERLREEVYKLSPKQVLEPVDTQILDGFGRLPE